MIIEIAGNIWHTSVLCHMFPANSIKNLKNHKSKYKRLNIHQSAPNMIFEMELFSNLMRVDVNINGSTFGRRFMIERGTNNKVVHPATVRQTIILLQIINFITFKLYILYRIQLKILSITVDRCQRDITDARLYIVIEMLHVTTTFHFWLDRRTHKHIK